VNGLRGREETGEILTNIAYLSQNGHYQELREFVNQGAAGGEGEWG